MRINRTDTLWSSGALSLRFHCLKGRRLAYKIIYVNAEMFFFIFIYKISPQCVVNLS